MTEFT